MTPAPNQPDRPELRQILIQFHNDCINESDINPMIAETTEAILQAVSDYIRTNVPDNTNWSTADYQKGFDAGIEATITKLQEGLRG